MKRNKKRKKQASPGTINPAEQQAFQTAISHYQSGNLQQAANVINQILTSNPNNPDALHMLGVLHFHSNNPEKAKELIKRAISLKNNDPFFYNSLANVHKEQGQLEEALPYYHTALKLNPAGDEALFANMAHTLQLLGRHGEAIESYRQALNLNGNNVIALINLGVVLFEQRQIPSAINCYERAIALQPNNPVPYNNLGTACIDAGDYSKAIEALEKAVALDPSLIDAHLNLCNTYNLVGDYDKAQRLYKSLYEKHPLDRIKIKMALLAPPVARSNEEITYVRDHIENDIDALMQENITIDNPMEEVKSTPFFLAYHGVDDRPLTEKIAQLYLKISPSLTYTASHCQSSETKEGQALRIGFVSKFFHDHSVGRCYNIMIQLIAQQQECEVLAFSPVAAIDDRSQALSSCTSYIQIPSDFIAARETIAEHKLDILVYTDIGMEPLTYFLAFARLAPVQCVLGGHPVTTGIPNVDYFLSTSNAEIENAQDFYSETLVTLSRMVFTGRPQQPPDQLKTRSELGLPEDAHLFISPVMLQKLHPDFDLLMGDILRKDPNAQIILFKSTMKTHWHEILRERFSNTIPDVADRITFHDWVEKDTLPHIMAAADAILDPLHFGCGSTAFLAFDVGAPIITLPTDYLRGRVMYAYYQVMELPELIAENNQEYADIALRLATDKAFYEEISKKIKEKSTVIYENDAVITELTEFFTSAHKKTVHP